MQRFYITLFSLFFSVSSFSQISVTSNSLKNWLGIEQMIGADTTGFVSVDVGSAGENQMWDFTNFQGQASFVATYELFEAQNTPHADEFPTANDAFSIGLELGGISGTMFQYMNLSDDQIRSLGSIIEADGMIIQRQRTNEVTPLPITYGSTWERADSDTTVVPGVGFAITNIEEKYTIDGWGIIKLPAGDFSCLRWKTEGTVEEISNIGGVDLPTRTTTYIRYDWIGENSIFLASVESISNETDPNFAIAGEVTWLSDVTGNTQVASTADMPQEFTLFANYPNPFNPSTTISFHLPSAENVSVRIYDVNGRVVRELMSQQLPTGSHQVTWNGMNDKGEPVASGTYFYQLETSTFRDTRKMNLLR